MPFKLTSRESSPARVLGSSNTQPQASSSSSSFSDKYQLGRTIGSGAFGEVWECSRRDQSSEDRLSPPGITSDRLSPPGTTSSRLACKVIQKKGMSNELRRAVQSEVSILRSVRGQHQGVIQLEEAFESQRAVQIVMEHCGGGDLFDLVSARKTPLPEHAAREVFRQLASAVEFLHSRGIVHRDIKPENILFKSPPNDLSTNDLSTPVQVKLVDFGLSVAMKPGETTGGLAGSPYYMAPEVLQGRQYGRRADVWSLGVVLAVMLTRKLPFWFGKGDGLKEMIKATSRGRVDFSLPCWRGVSKEAKDLVARMLQPDPVQRIRAHQLLDHPWCATGKPLQHNEATGETAELRLGSLIQASKTEEAVPVSVTRTLEGTGTQSAQGKLQSASCTEGRPHAGLAAQELSVEDEACEVTFGEFPEITPIGDAEAHDGAQEEAQCREETACEAAAKSRGRRGLFSLLRIKPMVKPLAALVA